MEQQENLMRNSCSFAGVRPIMVDLPYPPIQVSEKNLAYANLLSIDYCGAVSELSAITQYINNENRLSCEKCSMATTILGIAMAEMMHLQKLGELIDLLGGKVDFVAKHRNGRNRMWSPEFLKIPEQAKLMIGADIEAEQAAVNQYNVHISMIQDNCVNRILERIIMDEEYHITILQALMKEL